MFIIVFVVAFNIVVVDNALFAGVFTFFIVVNIAHVVTYSFLEITFISFCSISVSVIIVIVVLVFLCLFCN